MLGVYIYAVGSQSCATRLVFEGFAPLLGHRLRRLRFASGDTGCGPDRDRAWHPRALGKRRMRSSLASGKSATPPARCIHRPLRDTSSAGYHLLVSRASVGASRELSSRRSPAFAPHTCAVSPTFLYGAFFFVASALAAFLSARLTAYGNNAQTCILQRFRGVCPRRLYNHMPFSAICLMPNLPLDHNSATMTNLGKHGKEVFD